MESTTTTTATAMPNDDVSNKENIPHKGENNHNNKNKKKNPIPLVAPSFKKKSNRKTKRVPLADITHLFRNSAPLTTTGHEENGASSSDSVLLHSNSRRRTMVVVHGSKTLRMGFR